MNFAFVAALAIGLFVLLNWGVRTLPAERWQMLAAVPVAKAADGSWRGVNLTFYGFFSATGTAFGFTMMLLLLSPSVLQRASRSCLHYCCWLFVSRHRE